MRNPSQEPSSQQPQEPDRETVIQMIRGAVGPKLDALSQATSEAREAKRLLELAHWAGDREAETALRRALVMLAAATQANG
jgi:hypothetical protein